MPKTIFCKTVVFAERPARDLGNILYQIRPWLLAGIAAAVMEGTIGVLWYLFSFVMEPDLLAFLFKPLSIVTPILAAVVARLMTLDFYKWEQISFRRRPQKHIENPDTNLQPESARPA